MDLPVNHFKRAITSGKRPVGTWLSSGSPAAAEALGFTGFDFLVVDTEHTPIDVPQMTDILRAIAGTPAQAIVRPPWNDMVMLKRVLDAGAQSLLLPFVQNEEEAKRAVAFTRYPPAGVRGVAGTHRGSRFGTVPNYMKTAASELCVIVQIETLAALARLEAIAAVEASTRSSSGRTILRRRWVIWATWATRRCRKKSRSPPRNAAGSANLAGSSAARLKSSPPISSTAIHGSRSIPTWG